MITNKIKTRYWLLFVLLTTGLILSLVGLAVWFAPSRGEKQVKPEYFRSIYLLSTVGSVVFTVSLVIGALYLRKWAKH